MLKVWIKGIKIDKAQLNYLKFGDDNIIISVVGFMIN